MIVWSLICADRFTSLKLIQAPKHRFCILKLRKKPLKWTARTEAEEKFPLDLMCGSASDQNLHLPSAIINYPFQAHNHLQKI